MILLIGIVMKNSMILKNLLLFLFLIPYFGMSQISITSMPLDNQLVSRSISSNSGKFTVEGSVDLNQVSYEALRITIIRTQNGINTEYAVQEKSFADRKSVV